MSRPAPARPFRVGVIADDFTGAGDAALALGRGAEIAVLGPSGAPARPRGRPAVWVLDTESRHLPGPRARRRVRQAAQVLRRWGASFIYKKIDSTLRGPLRAEMEAFLEALPARGKAPLAFVPAFPRMGRATRGGRHFVEGTPLHRTPFARDPRFPVRTPVVANLLGPARSGLWVPDVEDQADLRRAARRVLEGRGVFPAAAAGSAGLAEELARIWDGGERAAAAPRRRVDGRKAKAPLVMVVVGSAHPASRRQAQILKRALGPRLIDVPAGGRANAPTRRADAPAAVYLLRAPRRRGSPGRVMEDLLRRASTWSRRAGIRRFVAAGGETAYGLCRSWREFRWRLGGRVDRGVALCASGGSPARWLVAKPGGFGDEDALVRSVKKLQGVL